MGYHSQWQLCIKARSTESLNKLVEYLLLLPATAPFPHRAEIADCVDCLLRNIDPDVPHTRGGYIQLVFGDDATKCYSPWGEVVRGLIELADRINAETATPEGNQVDVAYARIGEDMDDTEIDSTGGTYQYEMLSIERSLYVHLN